MPTDPILDANIRDFDTAYRLVVPQGDQLLAAAAAWYRKDTGRDPSPADLRHMVFWRMVAERERWGTPRKAWLNEHPNGGDPPPIEPLAPWHQSDVYLYDDRNVVQRFRGVAAFGAIMHHAQGNLSRLQVFADAARAAGVNTFVCFSCFDAVPSVGRPAFLATAEQIIAGVSFIRRDLGMRVWLVGFCDQGAGSDVQMTPGIQDLHWQECQDAGPDFLEAVNEPFKTSNGGYDLSALLPRPRAGILGTRGAVGDGATDTPYSAGPLWSLSAQNTRRQPGDQARRAKDALDIAVLGADTWAATRQPVVLREPFQISQATPRECGDYFALAELVSGGTCIHDGGWETVQNCIWPSQYSAQLDAIQASWTANVPRTLIDANYDRDSILTGDGVRHYVMHRDGHGVGVAVGASQIAVRSDWKLVERRGYEGAIVIVGQ